MACIKITELQPSGFELFTDSAESYLDQVTDSDLLVIKGGSTPACAAGLALGAVALFVGSAALGFSIVHQWNR